MTGAQLSLRTLCSVSMVHNCICVQLNRAQTVAHNRRGVRLVGEQLYPRVACPVDMVHSYSRAQSVRAQLIVLNRYRAQSYGAQSVPSPILCDFGAFTSFSAYTRIQFSIRKIFQTNVR